MHTNVWDRGGKKFGKLVLVHPNIAVETAIKNATKILDQKENHDTGKHFPFTKVHLGVEVFEKHKTDPN